MDTFECEDVCEDEYKNKQNDELQLRPVMDIIENNDNIIPMQYSFALNPESHKPSGSCNFSRIEINNSDYLEGSESGPGSESESELESESYWSIKNILIAPIGISIGIYIGYKMAQWYL